MLCGKFLKRGFEGKESYQLYFNAGENSDGFHGSGHSPLAIGVKFHPEARVNSPHFAEGASQGSPRKAGTSQLREKLASPDQNFAAPAVDDSNFVNAVPRL